ncbi:MAG: 50S ribosomal protein L21 [bacterium]|nr:50S ribosomal protein L21 [bacterium]
MIAVVKTGGKQYKVREGEVLNIELIDQNAGDTVDLDVLLVGEETGESIKVGTPTVSGAKVTAKVLEHGKGKKVLVVKYKPKVRYKRSVGHRQPFTKVQIEKITS